MTLQETPMIVRQQRVRRFSDADLGQSAAFSSQPESASIRSRDGSRWLPVPAEITHLIGLKGSLAPDMPTASSSSSSSSSSRAKLPQPHSCSRAVCAVIKTFETTELLELILTNLQSRDVLTLRRVSPMWDATILQSPKLRLHFFVFPEFSRPATDFKLLQSNIAGLVIDLGEEIHLGQWIRVSMTKDAARTILPPPGTGKRVRSRSIYEGLRGGLGSRSRQSSDQWPASVATTEVDRGPYEDLFFCQPPVVGMQAFVIPNAPLVKSGGEVKKLGAKLSWDSGITLGFMAESAQTLLAAAKDEGSDGSVASVEFKTIVSFCAPEQAPRKRGVLRSFTMLG